MARREGLYEVDGELVSERTPPVRWRAPCRSRLPRVRASWRWRCLQSLLTAAMFRHGTCEGTRSVPVVQIRRVQTMNPAAVPPGRVTLSGRAAVCPQRISQRQRRYMPPTLLRSQFETLEEVGMAGGPVVRKAWASRSRGGWAQTGSR